VNQYASQIILNTINTSVKGIAGYLASESHKKMKESFPAYAAVTDTISEEWNNNAFLKEMRHWLNIDDFKQFVDKNKFLSGFLDAEQKRNTINNTLITKMKTLIDGYSTDEKERKKLSDVYARTGIFSLMETENLYNKISTGNMTIDEAIKMMEDKIGFRGDINIAKNVGKMYITGKVSGTNTSYNLSYVDDSPDSDKSKNMKALTTLYALKEIDGAEKVMQKVRQEHNDLNAQFVSVALALSSLNKKVYDLTGDVAEYRGNLISDIYTEPVDMRVITVDDVNSGRYSESSGGWKMLRKPGARKYGIVYRKRLTSYQSGAGTTTSYEVNDLYINKPNPNFGKLENNAVDIITNNGTRTKLLLTNEEKASLRSIESAPELMVRAMSHLQMIADTEIMRKEMISGYTQKVMTKSDEKDLVKNIENKDIEHPWFVKLSDDMLFTDLDPKIRNEYKVVNNLTRVGGFNKKITLVRVDISPWLTGYKDAEPFNNQSMRKFAYVVKQLVTMSKIKMAIANPAKVASDMVSGLTLLVMKNVPIPKIALYGKQTMNHLADLSKIRNEYVSQLVLVNAYPNNKGYAKKLDSLKNQLKNHPIAPALYNGMIQSLSTEVILKDFDSVTGLQTDIENMLNRFLLKTKTGDKTTINKYIMKFSKFGFQMEDIVLSLSKQLDGKAPDSVSKYLKESSERLRTIKTRDDAAKYLSQFIASPDSEITKLGSAAVQYADIVPRIILYKHLKDIGKTEEEAVKESLESYIDYKVNMPMPIKTASDYFLLPFPSFWMRIQKIVYGLGTEKPVSVAAAYGIGELTHLHLSNIVQSNIFTRFAQGNILSTPEIGLDTIFIDPATFNPMNIFENAII
jgi:hypothetical protein